MLQPAGFGDELRVALRTGGVCWGFLTLFRPLGQPTFQEQECALLASVAPLIAERLRAYASVLPVSGADRAVPEDNGILVLSERLVAVSANAAARYWLKQIWNLEQLEEGQLPGPVRAVCLRVLGAKKPAGAGTSQARISLPIGDGAYLTVTASLLGGPQTQLAVSLVSARLGCLPGAGRSLRPDRTGEGAGRAAGAGVIDQGAGRIAAYLRLHGTGSFEIHFRQDRCIQPQRADQPAASAIRVENY